MRTFVGSMSALAVSLVATGTAFAAGGPTLSAYGGPGAVHSQVAGAVSPIAASKPAGGTLPFTGLDLGIAIAVALGLIALGFASRRWGKRSAA